MIYLTLFWTFFKIGLFTFGGGYAMLPLIQQYVLGFNWLSEEELVNFVAVSESTPGPFAINIATYVGSSQAGVLGALCTTLGVVLPSFVIILIVAKCYMAFKESLVVRGMMNGLKPVVVGLIGSAVISFAAAVFFPAELIDRHENSSVLLKNETSVDLLGVIAPRQTILSSFDQLHHVGGFDLKPVAHVLLPFPTDSRLC